MSSISVDATKKIQDQVRTLFDSMSGDFREHLMHSLFLSQGKLKEYLDKNVQLEGDTLKEAFSHLESLLSRIEAYAEEKQADTFMTYDEWVDKEYEAYKEALKKDDEDIGRLMGEGGVDTPKDPEPVDVMANDSVSHYNHLKKQYEATQARSDEAIKLMHSDEYKKLKSEADKMEKMIEGDVSHH